MESVANYYFRRNRAPEGRGRLWTETQLEKVLADVSSDPLCDQMPFTDGMNIPMILKQPSTKTATIMVYSTRS